MKITLKRAISPITSFCPRAKKDFSTNSIHYNKIKLPSSDKKQSLAIVWDFFCWGWSSSCFCTLCFSQRPEVGRVGEHWVLSPSFGDIISPSQGSREGAASHCHPPSPLLPCQEAQPNLFGFVTTRPIWHSTTTASR